LYIDFWFSILIDFIMAVSISLTGNSSYLETTFFPPIQLKENTMCGLVSLITTNSIPNITNLNNRIKIDSIVYKVPVGAYEMEDLIQTIYDLVENKNTKNPPEVQLYKNTYYKSYYIDHANSIQNTESHIDEGHTFNQDEEIEIKEYDKFGFMGEEVKIPKGKHSVEEVNVYLNSILLNKQNDKNKKLRLFSIIPNVNTQKVSIFSSMEIDFDVKHSIAKVFGFTKRRLGKNRWYTSDSPVSITNVNSIKVHCNIVSGSYDNNKPSHIIHECDIRVPVGYKMSEIPTNVIYFPVTVKEITSLVIKLTNQDLEDIDLLGEKISIRLHLKS